MCLNQKQKRNEKIFLIIFIYNNSIIFSIKNTLYQAYISLSKKYDEIYLIRNEKHFKLYTFDEGQALEPDFVLFLKKKDNSKSIIHQMFIEPKGGDRLTNEDSQIKERFLLQLEKDYKLQVVYENRDYKLVGMPLYNEAQKKTEFDNKFKVATDI